MKKQLTRIFVMFGIIPAILLTILISWLSAQQGEAIVEEQVIKQLSALRETKKSEIEAYFETLSSQAKTYSSGATTVDAMKGFKEAFRHYREETLTLVGPQERQSLNNYYVNEFNERFASRNMQENFDVAGTIAQLDNDSIALQYAYISKNPKALGEKNAFIAAADSSTYSRLHREYHPHFNKYLNEFGFYDIFLVDPDSGDIVYSVFKGLDYTTSLKSGPYADTAIGEAFRQANSSKVPDSVHLTDFAPYGPSYNDPAAFISSPVYDGNTKVGVLIMQMPIDRINDIMNYAGRWADAGMGQSGETYLVSDDLTMRSMSRLLIEDKTGYIAALEDANASSAMIKHIDQKETTIGLQTADTKAVKAALSGETGHALTENYRGDAVLSSYSPLNISGQHWVIISESLSSEAFAPVANLLKTILLWSLAALAIITALTTFIGYKYASVFVAPLYYVTGSLKYIAKDIKANNVDLTQLLDPPGNSKLAKEMADGINVVLSNFASVLKEFTTVTDSISVSTEQVKVLSHQSTLNMSTQSAETSQVATAITELAASSSEVANTARQGAKATRIADQDTKAGTLIVNEAVSTITELADNLTSASGVINHLDQDSESIGTVIAVIQSIAEQTNLLALNAAIEAARAGEQGRGFAVVADEVRTLAARTQDATQEIKDIIDQLQARSKEAVKVMDEGCIMANIGLEKAVSAGQALTNIESEVADIDNMNMMIDAASQEQRAVAEEVNQNVVRISSLTEKTEEGAKQTSKASEDLLFLAKELQTLTSQFKV